MSATRSNVLRLFKTMMRESQLFTSYNFRNYAIRRIRDAFKANKNLQDCDAIEAAYNEAFTTLAIIKRQVVIADMYKTDKLVLERVKQ
ncbi:conserved hypothetical protein [Pediculus humanus corporis]|uniref:Complex 1 LYR protein domain-containing protein n=1 Tax=Pediculus humanus subsp. corporis TaxID=121224 RepID=E0VTX8_PEDHC|nr:uncharacterized protein Phum_PHUM440100 [Pediculus humanus corporis]EEB16834.1 conserved hypothetical protein [Pediculus humanus corporis]